MKIVYNILLLSFLLSFHFFSQPIDNSWMIYDDSQVAVVRITLDPNDLEFMYGNPESDSMHLAQVYFKNAFVDEIVDSVGFRLRGNTSRQSYKKSFKLSFNTFVRGREFYSLEKMNLNGEHNDPSIVRSKLCWDFYNDIGVVSSRAAHIAVYINGKYFGLYISIEHMDEEFINKNFNDDTGNLWKCLFGADLVYISDNSDLYKFENDDGSRPYALKTNKDLDDYSKLGNLINVINNSEENFEKSLESILNVKDVVKYLVTNILVGGWDDYWSLSNNYYLYHNPSTNKFDLIPYDYDNTFGIAWWTHIDWETVSPYTFGQIFTGPRPLADNLMQSAKYRNLFSHFLEFYSTNVFNTSEYFDKLIQLRTKIQAYAEQDTFKTKDWGITNQVFLRSFDQPDFSYENGSYIVPNSIKGFIENRSNSLNSQITYLDHQPIIYDFKVPNNLQANENLTLNASVFSHKGISSVKLQYTINGVEQEQVALSFSPILESKIIEETDLWSITLPSFGIDRDINFKFIAEDTEGGITVYPENGIDLITPSEVSNEVLINELMSLNTSTITDELNEFDDWIELYNPQDTSVNLSGKYLTDKKDNLTKWQFPVGISLEPNQYTIIWCDEDQPQGNAHTNFKLSSTGEFLALVDTDGISIMDSVRFPSLSENESFARENDSGSWFITSSSTPGASNTITDIENNNLKVYSNRLEAYPNPFNPSTNIEYEISKSMNIELKIFNVLGQEVWKNRKEEREAGNYTIQWKGRDKNGNELASGIYLASVIGEAYNKTIKLMLLR